jgi:ketosteroid isomerase-like protein
MTPADNKALMQRLYEGLAVGDATLFRQHLADQPTFRVMGRSSWAQDRVGADSYGAYWRYVRSIMKSGTTRSIPERFIADGDIVAVESRGDNTSTDGQRYDNLYCMVYQLRDGKIVEAREYMDTAFTEQVFGPFPAELRPEG